MCLHDDLFGILLPGLQKGIDCKRTAMKSLSLLKHSQQDGFQVQGTIGAHLNAAFLFLSRFHHVGGDLVQLKAHVGFVDGAEIRNQAAQFLCNLPDIAGKRGDNIRLCPSAPGNQPGRAGKMMQRDNGGNAMLPAAEQHLTVMLNFFFVKAPLLRLDPRPFDAETIGIAAGSCQQGNILRVAVIMIAGFSTGLCEITVLYMLHQPIVAVSIIALHLVRSGGRADEKRKFSGHYKLSPFSRMIFAYSYAESLSVRFWV